MRQRCTVELANTGCSYYCTSVVVDANPVVYVQPVAVMAADPHGTLGNTPDPPYLMVHKKVKHMLAIFRQSSQTRNSAVFQEPPQENQG